MDGWHHTREELDRFEVCPGILSDGIKLTPTLRIPSKLVVEE
jgi:hypothetical protein